MSLRARSVRYLPSLDLSCVQVQFQPQVSVRTQQVVAIEALLCYDDLLYGRVEATEVLRRADESGLMGELTTQVLTQALVEASMWRGSTECAPLRIGVNLSRTQLLDPNLPDRILAALTAAAVPPSLLELEVSELDLAPMLASSSMTRLLGRGVHLTVDDFTGDRVTPSALIGCGADALKIDKAVIDGIGEEPDSGVTARAIIDVAHELGLTVTAEGVETTDQLAFLQEQSCDRVQGYLMSRPLAPDALARFLRRHANPLE
jgi:EAL domain-containing protein (putative c-di-GMP-specific phosphodiesterase class I)